MNKIEKEKTFITINSDIEQYLEESNLKIKTVPGDGHCIIHAVIEAIFHQNSKSKYYSLLADIISEYMDNTAYWNGFFSMEAESIQAAFFDFTDKKEWNNVACDTIPLIISKIINKNIIVIEPIIANQINIINISFDKYSSKIAILKHNNHYDALISEDNYLDPKDEQDSVNIFYNIIIFSRLNFITTLYLSFLRK